MTTAEFREEISKTNNPNWFKTADLNIQYPHINFSISLEGLSSIHKFFSNQINGWNKFENLPPELIESKNHFEKLKSTLERFLANHREADENQLNNSWRNARSVYSENRNYFTYDSPQTEFLIKIYEEKPTAYLGAYKYITGTFDINNKDRFIGAILAYEFDLKDQSEILKRRDKEKRTLSRLRNDLREQISETEIQVTENINNTKEKFENYSSQIDELRENKENYLTSGINKLKKILHNLMKIQIERLRI